MKIHNCGHKYSPIAWYKFVVARYLITFLSLTSWCQASSFNKAQSGEQTSDRDYNASKSEDLINKVSEN